MDPQHTDEFDLIDLQQTEVLNWLEGQQTAMEQLLTTACNINSYTPNVSGVDRVRSLFQAEFEAIGSSLSTVSVPPNESINDRGEKIEQPIGDCLQVIKRPESPRQVFLCIHLDTVYSPESPFQTITEIEPGTWRGPGIIDAKGGAVIMLFALKAFEKFSAANNLGWEVVLNSDEEIGSPSSQAFLKERCQHHDFGLLYEPALADGTLVDNRKGSGNFSVIVRGQSVHSGREFEKGRNAVIAASEAALKLHHLNDVHDEVTINVARMDGGGPFNVVPDLAVLRVNVRVADQQQQHWFEAAISEIVKTIDQKEGFSCELHGAFFSPPKNMDEPTKRLKQVVQDSANSLNLPVSWRKTGGVCDGNKLAAAGLPNIDTMGARGGQIHSPEEYLIRESLVERAKLSALILMRYAVGEFTLD